MLLVGKDLASYTLAAGEPFVLEVQLLDSAGRATDLDDQAMVLTFYTAGTRALVTDFAGAPSQYEGERLSDTTGEYFRWAFDGRWSEAMLSNPGLRVELAQRLFYGRSIISTGTLSVVNSSAVVPSLPGGSIALTAVRVSIKANATLGGAPQITQSVILYDGPSVPVPAPVFTTPTSIASDGTPQVGELLTGIDGIASNATSYSRRWLLGSTVLTTSATYTATAGATYRYEMIADGPGGQTISGSNITVAAASPVLNALTISPSTATVGTAYSGTINGLTSGSSIALSGAGAAGLSIAGAVITGTPTTAGAVNIIETLAGATGSPRTSSAVVGVSVATSTPSPTPTPSGVPMVFWDTDAEKDPDDAMAWGVTEGMRREGELNVGSVTIASRIEKSPAGFRGLVDYAGLNNVPVGAYKGSALSTNSQATWTPALAIMLGTTALGRALFPDAVSVLRKAINDYTGNNGIIFCAGPTTNVTDLLKSGANHNGDGINLTGMQLVAAKIVKIVVMGGNWPNSTSNEYNVKFDVESQRYLAANSPVPVYYGGASHVGQTRCGPALTQDENLDPFRKALVASSDTIDANGKRTGYDPAAFLYGIRTAASPLFNEVRGTASFYQVDGVGDGTNFVASASGNHYYCTIENVAAINAEMDRLLGVAYDAPYALPAPTGLVAGNIFGGEADIAYASLLGACGMEYQVGSGAWTAATPVLNANGVINKVRVVIAPGSSIKLRGIRPGQVGAASTSIIVGTAAPAEPVPTTFPGTLFTGTSAAAGLLYDIKPENCRASRDGTGEAAAVDGPVGRIMDMSGLGMHAVAISDADRWILRFDGTRYYVEGSSTLKGYEIGAATDLNFAQVALSARVKQNSTSQYQTLIGKPQVVGAHSSPFYRWGIVPKSATGYAARVNGNEILATNAGDLQLVHTVSLDTASFTLRKDGTQIINGTDDPAITYPNNVKARIGSHGGGGEIYNGRLYRLVLANRPFTQEELTNIETWVAA